jgi:hypothetical protein
VPIVVATLATLVVQQGQVLAFDLAEGLTWVGFLTLAVTVTRYVDRADQIVTRRSTRRSPRFSPTLPRRAR